MQMLRRARIVGIIFTLLLCLAIPGHASSKAQISQAVDNANLVTLYGNVHPLAQAKFDQGAAPGSLAMKHMLLLLKRDRASEQALEAAVAAQQNPLSSSYHKWLTPKQFHSSFGVADQDVTVIASWLTSQGFSDVTLSAGGTILEFSGTASVVRSAFHTDIHQYKVSGVSHWANATNPKVPAAIAPAVNGVVSLNNFERKSMRKDMGVFNYSKKTGWQKGSTAAQTVTEANPNSTGSRSRSVKPNYTAVTSSGDTYRAVGPADFGTVYNVTPLWNAGIDGTGQEIAIVGRSAITEGDIDQFRSAFGLPATKLKTVLAGDMPDHTSSEAESLLDIEWSGAIAKNATIDYVVAASTDTTDGIDLASLYAVDNNVAPILSVSYGQCELGLGTTGNAFYNELWRQAAAEGITVLVATGDGSAATCDQGYSEAEYGLTVNGIASTPYNVSVGGTDFNDFGGSNGVVHSDYWSATNDPTTLGSALSYIPEMVWNDSCANNQIYPYLGFSDAETFCNDDTAYVDGLLNVVGGGGGISSCTTSTDSDPSTCTGGYDKPAWQNTAGVPDDGKRNLPDLSLFAADGVTGSFYLYCMSSNTPNGKCDYSDTDNLSYMGAGGTSFATPAFAGVMALVNQKTSSSQGNANYVLYSLARTQFGTTTTPLTSTLSACSSDLGKAVGASCVFRDVVTGDNAVPCYNGYYNCTITTASDQYGVTSGYNATSGFDPATGLGSINALNLVNGWTLAAQLTPSTTTLTVTPTSGNYGTTLSYAITVAPTSGKGTPTGSVILLADNASIASADLSSSSASGTINTLGAGKHTVTARYASDGIYASSISDSVEVNVAQVASSTKLSLNEVNPITGATTKSSVIHYGSNAIASATTTGISNLTLPSGNVSFASTGSDSQTVALNSGVASATLTQLAVGASESSVANYAGDSNYTASSSDKLSFTVAQAVTAVRLASSTTYQVGAGSLTLSATAYSYSSGDKPTGNIDLYINGVKYASQASSAVVDAISGGVAGTAQFTVPSSALTTGANAFTATYSGDGNYLTATSAALNVGFGATTPTSSVTLSATPSSAATQQTVALTAAAIVGGIPATAGSVAFYDGDKKLGESAIIRTSTSSSTVAGSAYFYTRLSSGTHAITAKFSGFGATPAASADKPVALTITGTEPSTTALSVAVNSIHETHYDFTATVTGNGFTAPSGTISLNETSTIATLATATPDASTSAMSYATGNIFSLSNTAEFLAVGDLSNNGIPDVVIRRAGDTTDDLDVYIGNGDGTYKDPVEYAVGTASRGHQIVIADFNGDGFNDVTTVNQGEGTVSILIGNGDGTLQQAFSVAVQSNPITLSTADVNHDGIPDLLTISTGSSNVAVLLGNGDGSFQAPVTTNLDTLPEYPAFGDIDGDGNLDIVYASIIDWPSVLHIAKGNRDGTFTLADSTIALTSDDSIISIVLGDVNNDGKLDAVMAGNYAGNVLVSLGDGKGGFAAPVSYVGGYNQPYTKSAQLVDVNNDGKLDIAVLDAISADVNILYNNGDGTFGAPTSYSTAITLPSELYVADVNGDGVPDLLQTSQSHGDTQAVLLLGGNKTTVKLRDIAANGSSDLLQQGVAVFNGDTTYTASTSNPVTFYGAGKQSTPQIQWTPSSTTWGVNTALGVGILDATTYGSIAGTYVYTAQLAGGAATTINATSQLNTVGVYTLTVTFTPADKTSYTTATSQVALTVIDSDFTITTPSSTSLSLSAGGTATTTVTIAPLYGFGGYVTLSCTTPAAGISCSASPTSVAPGGSATVTVSTTATSTKAQNQHNPSTNLGFIAGGAAASFLLVGFLPFKLRKRGIFAMTLMLLFAVSMAVGCGSSNSTKSSTLKLTTSNADAPSGSAITLTADLLSNGNAASNQVVNFYDGSTFIGSSTAASGVATLSVSNLGVGVHSLTAQFAGDKHLVASTSNALSQVIAGKSTITVTAVYGSLSHAITTDLTIK